MHRWGALQSNPGLGGRGGVEIRQDWTAVGKPWAVGRRGWAERFLPFSVLDDFYGKNISYDREEYQLPGMWGNRLPPLGGAAKETGPG